LAVPHRSFTPVARLLLGGPVDEHVEVRLALGFSVAPSGAMSTSWKQ
jgi:hypothetical protein